MTNLCDKCGREPWVAPVFVGLKPTEQWGDNCIQTEINAGSAIEVLGDYLETKKRKKVLRLLDQVEYLTNEARIELKISEIRELLTELWGEQE